MAAHEDTQGQYPLLPYQIFAKNKTVNRFHPMFGLVFLQLLVLQSLLTDEISLMFCLLGGEATFRVVESREGTFGAEALRGEASREAANK